MKSAREIAARAVCMGVLEFRARFEGTRFRGDAVPETTEMIAGVTSWLHDAGLSPSLLDAERALLAQKPNTWAKETLAALEQALLTESLGVLFAGMNLASEILPYDSFVNAEPLLRTLPFLSDSPFVTRPGMPAREEWASMANAVTAAGEADIAAAERIAGLWWWRAVSESLVQAGKLPRAQLAGILRDGEARCHQLDIPFANGDFTAFGKPYEKLAPAEQRAVSAIAEARVRGLRWILDDAAPWDGVSMDS